MHLTCYIEVNPKLHYPTRTKEKQLSHATSIGNKRKQTEDRKTFVISNILSIVTSPSKKKDHNEVNAIQDLFQCSISSAYRQQKKLQQNVYI